LHKRTSYIATYDTGANVVQEANLLNDRRAICAYFAALPGQHKAALEATPNWFWLADLLGELGVEMQLAHTTYLKAITYAKVKTDQIDAHTLAQLLRLDMIPQAHQISHELRWPRDLLRTRLILVTKRTAANNSIKWLLSRFNAKNEDELPSRYHLQLGCFQSQITLLNEQIKQLGKTLQNVLAPKAEVRHLATIPGIGPIGAYTMHLEIDGIERFPTENQFFSYCRLVPGAKNSANNQRHKSNKAGNRYLKLAFSHSAVRAIQHYKEIKDFYRTKRRKKPERIARNLVAKELANIVYHVLKDQTDFNGSFKGKPLSRTKTLAWPLRASPPANLGAEPAMA
jgi:transposase